MKFSIFLIVAVAGTQAVEKVFQSMLIGGIDYGRLSIDAGLKTAVRNAVREGIAFDQMFTQNDVVVGLSSDSVVSLAQIPVPAGATAAHLLRALRANQTSSAQKTLQLIRAIPGIYTVITGELTVTVCGEDTSAAGAVIGPCTPSTVPAPKKAFQSFFIGGIDYSRLSSDAALKIAVETAVKQAFQQPFTLVGLSRGSVVSFAPVPARGTADDLARAMLASPLSSARLTLQLIRAIPSITGITGEFTVTVCGVSAACDSSTVILPSPEEKVFQSMLIGGIDYSLLSKNAGLKIAVKRAVQEGTALDQKFHQDDVVVGLKSGSVSLTQILVPAGATVALLLRDLRANQTSSAQETLRLIRAIPGISSAIRGELKVTVCGEDTSAAGAVTGPCTPSTVPMSVPVSVPAAPVNLAMAVAVPSSSMANPFLLVSVAVLLVGLLVVVQHSRRSVVDVGDGDEALIRV